MLKRLRDRVAVRRPAAPELCERCGVVCDAACRSRAERERVRLRALRDAALPR